MLDNPNRGRVPMLPIKHFNSKKHWNLLSGIMAQHMNWSVSRCIRHINNNNLIKS